MSASRDKPAEVIRATEQPGADRLRTVIEMTVCLVILVALFRTFLAGGYMIETGSMAPCLLGNHRQAVCPSCRYSFAVEDRESLLDVCAGSRVVPEVEARQA